MPIYAYRCTNCGHALDVLRKISDPPLTVCPSCGQPTLAKQVTAAGFQLKGSGWYVTDFRGDKSTGKPAPAEGGAAAEGKAGDAPAESAKGEGAAKGDNAAKKPESAAAPAPASTPAPAAAPAASAPAPTTPTKGGT
jgi:putative FmdB family regulatory protein